MNFIHYNESLMLLETYMTYFGLLILQGSHIKQEELICQKSIFILQGIRFLFNKDSSTIISLGYFLQLFVAKGEK